MDKRRIYAIVSDREKTIFATRKTKLQADNMVDYLITIGHSDASIIANDNNQLCHKKYDKYKFLKPLGVKA